MTRMRTVVLVGHCGPDMHMLRASVNRSVPGVPIVLAMDADALKRHLGPDAVLLVNRVLDGDFDSESGIELIREIGQLPHPPMMMLVSNFADAQAEAVAAGAQRGFGKSQLYAQPTIDALRAAVLVDRA